MASKKKTLQIASHVFIQIGRDHKIKPSEVAGDKFPAARAQLWKSIYDGGDVTLTQIADHFGSTAPTVFRNLQKFYPKDFPGRA